MEELKIQGLTKHYKKFKALDNINLNIKPGMFGLLGSNGAGKTTLMRTIVPLLTIESGNITYGNMNWNKGDEVRKIIGYLPQEFSMYKKIKVQEVMQHIGTMKGMKRETIDNEVEKVLKKVNLLECKNKRMEQLSGGMVRRVGIAQAILGNPKILVIDEPTAGLDPENRIKFRNVLTDIGKDMTIIISTHIVEDIETTCDQVGVLNKGKLVFSGSAFAMKKEVQKSIYEIVLDKDKFYDYRNQLNMVFSKYEQNEYKVRFLVDEKHKFIPEGSYNVDASLEDAFLKMVGNIYEEE